MNWCHLLSLRRYPEFLRLAWWKVVTPAVVRRKGVEIGSGTTFYGTPIISMVEGSKIIINERASLCSVSEFTALGVNHPVVLRTMRPGAMIEVGAETGVSGATICAAGHVKIGKQCMFGANVVIADTDFHAMKPENRRYNSNHEDIAVAPVFVEDNVFLGTGVIVLKGSTIGENTIVGAGSVVVGNIPANSIAAGNPARVIRAV
ncbi:acyltransferase [Geobacter sp.]|uniref:acyltransferase n=1 Tax=Geobacter sp. TaxID=46610 RepID=UPI002619793A|nr:acyltransferase [Geobacter sp.]